MIRSEGRVRPWLLRGLRSVWRSLVCMGAVYTGPVVYYYAVSQFAAATGTHDPFARYAPGGLQLVAGAPCSLPPGHPERVRADLPLSETEQRLAREL
ncbi:DUF6059 family protein [Streptomyces sp. NPDC046939]|uniref:DUF6059 family protein n=1 Tax=Streptomyces sp. NPDC046939 TaxID=3155376 RepID=UPI0033DAF4B1